MEILGKQLFPMNQLLD